MGTITKFMLVDVVFLPGFGDAVVQLSVVHPLKAQRFAQVRSPHPRWQNLNLAA